MNGCGDSKTHKRKIGSTESNALTKRQKLSSTEMKAVDFDAFPYDESLRDLPMFACRQPCADAILYGGKNIENRSKPIPKSYGLPCRVLMAAPMNRVPLAESKRIQTLYPHDYDTLRCGVLLGVVEIVDCQPYELCQNERWASNEGYCWRIGRVFPFVSPIRVKCALGWKLSDTERENFSG